MALKWGTDSKVRFLEPELGLPLDIGACGELNLAVSDGKKLVTKTSKSRRTFYSCEDYPNCSFSCWDIPTDETCPKCGAMVLKKKYKNIRYCSKNCGWTSEGEKKSES